MAMSRYGGRNWTTLNVVGTRGKWLRRESGSGSARGRIQEGSSLDLLTAFAASPGPCFLFIFETWLTFFFFSLPLFLDPPVLVFPNFFPVLLVLQ